MTTEHDAPAQVPTAMPVLQRTYLKSMNVELPAAPHGFLDRSAPHLDCNINKRHYALAPHVHEVVVAAFVSVTLNGRVLLLVRAEQAGIFDLSGCAESEHGRLLNVVCPTVLMPYLRTQIADAMQRATVSPFTIPDVDWGALWQKATVPAPSPTTALH